MERKLYGDDGIAKLRRPNYAESRNTGIARSERNDEVWARRAVGYGAESGDMVAGPCKIVCWYMYMLMSVCAYNIYIYLYEWRIAIRRGILSQSGNCW